MYGVLLGRTLDAVIVTAAAATAAAASSSPLQLRLAPAGLHPLRQTPRMPTCSTLLHTPSCILYSACCLPVIRPGLTYLPIVSHLDHTNSGQPARPVCRGRSFDLHFWLPPPENQKRSFASHLTIRIGLPACSRPPQRAACFLPPQSFLSIVVAVIIIIIIIINTANNPSSRPAVFLSQLVEPLPAFDLLNARFHREAQGPE